MPALSAFLRRLARIAPPPAAAGFVVRPSRHSVAATLDRLEAGLKARGIGVFARVDHAAGAQQAGMNLRPMQLLVFGNPRLGTPLMQSNPRIGLELPLRVLAWEDGSGAVWLGYTAPADLAARHHISDRAEAVEKMTAVLDTLTTQAAQP